MRSLSLPLDRRGRAPVRFGLGMLLGLAAPGNLAAGPVAAQEAAVPTIVPVMVDNAKLIRLPELTRTVIVGNPTIADVTIQRNGIVVLTGKSFGTTNLIALDAGGTMIAESLIRVEASQGLASTVTVQRGFDRESYSCTPNCQPMAQLGDSTKWFSDVNDRAEKRKAGAAGTAAAAPGGGVGGGGGAH